MPASSFGTWHNPKVSRRAVDPDLCSFPNCGAPIYLRKLCGGHYTQRRFRRELRPIHRTPEARFWSKVNKDGPIIRPELGPCWLWTGATTTWGYGKLKIPGPSREHIGAHRYAYEMTNAPPPAGFDVCHKCDNPPCVRPGHLFAGTRSDNMRDCVQKGRRRDRSGENSVTAKLTWKSVAEVRARAKSGEDYVSIAKSFGLDPTTVGCCVRYKSWINPPPLP